MNLLGCRLFKKRPNLMKTRSVYSNKIDIPVLGYPNLPMNLMAKVWNDVPELQSATTLASAKRISQKWAKSIPR